MSSKFPTATHCFWLDVESTTLPTEHDEIIDFTGVHILEVGVILTDVGLNIITEFGGGGYQAVTKLTMAAADSLRANEITREMHKENGLIVDCSRATQTLADIDTELDEWLTETGVAKGMWAIAGSGVAAFDHPLVKAKMPKVASWLAYYPYDWGIFRRCIASAAGQYVVNPQLASYGDAKVHRAFNDVEAHLREAQSYRDWVRSLPAPE